MGVGRGWGLQHRKSGDLAHIAKTLLTQGGDRGIGKGGASGMAEGNGRNAGQRGVGLWLLVASTGLASRIWEIRATCAAPVHSRYLNKANLITTYLPTWRGSVNQAGKGEGKCMNLGTVSRDGGRGVGWQENGRIDGGGEGLAVCIIGKVETWGHI